MVNRRTTDRRSLDIRRSIDLAGCEITGEHFVLKSGRHSDAYIDCDPLFTKHGLLLPIFNYWYSQWFDAARAKPDVIVAPAVGGVYLVGAFAFYSQDWDLCTVWADKERDDFVLSRAGFAAAVRGKRVLVLEDVITTGGSVMKTIAAVRAAGGSVVGVACIVNRTSAVTAETLDVPRFTIGLQLDIQSWELEQLPAEILRRPIVTDLAHGAKFRDEHPDWEYGYTEVHFHD